MEAMTGPKRDEPVRKQDIPPSISTAGEEVRIGRKLCAFDWTGNADFPTTPWFYLFLGLFWGQIFAQCTTRRREPFSLECLILQRDLGEGTKCIPRPNIRTRGWALFLHLNLALSNTTGGNYTASMDRRPHFQQRERQTRRYR